MEAKILQRAVGAAISSAETKGAGESIDTNITVDGHNVSLRIYHPGIMYQTRRSRGITDEEIIEENNNGPYIASTRLGDYDSDSLMSSRERFVVQNLSNEEYDVLKEIFSDYSSYVLANTQSFLTAYFAFFRVQTSGKSNFKSPYFVMYGSFFPRLNHEHLHFLNLKGDEERPSGEGTVFKTEADLTWEHEISFQRDERQEIMDQLQADVTFLAEKNLTNFVLLIAITKRLEKLNMRLPGMPYGPDIDMDDDRKKTLPIRHDVRNGAKAVAEALIPKPKFSDEHPDWEYYITLHDIFTPFKKSSKIGRAFRGAFGGSGGADVPLVAPLDYAERMMSLLDSKVLLLPFDD